MTLNTSMNAVSPEGSASSVANTTNSEPVYEVRGIGKSYGHVVALQGVDISVRAGEVVGLVGDNGAGKSTLVKVLSGVHKPDEGTILLDGVERDWSSPHEALTAGIETLYQDSGLAADLSISGNVFLGREIVKPGPLGKLGFLDNKRMDAGAYEHLERAGITLPVSRRPINVLSGGQRQAVAIGRAITWARKVVILDEPTNHLGARQAEIVLDVIRAARSNGLGVILVSHTLPHVLAVTDRIVVLRLGRKTVEAPTSEFTDESLIRAITGLTP